MPGENYSRQLMSLLSLCWCHVLGALIKPLACWSCRSGALQKRLTGKCVRFLYYPSNIGVPFNRFGVWILFYPKFSANTKWRASLGMDSESGFHMWLVDCVSLRYVLRGGLGVFNVMNQSSYCATLSIVCAYEWLCFLKGKQVWKTCYEFCLMLLF